MIGYEKSGPSIGRPSSWIPDTHVKSQYQLRLCDYWYCDLRAYPESKMADARFSGPGARLFVTEHD
jgi:hypothetical protein